MRQKIFKNLNIFARLVAFNHTVFALPFALLAVLAAGKHSKIQVAQIIYIIFAVASARTAAMGWNRILDAEIDARNPRTQEREIPKGQISLKAAQLLVLTSILLFFSFSYLLGVDCLVLSPFVLIILLGYSFTKRFTSGAHLVLGLALALAPGGAWFAITHEFSVIPLPLMFAVLFWVSGFDIIYSAQDVDFDRSAGLHSIPVRLGVPKALLFSRVLHVFALMLLALFGNLAELNWGFWIGYGVFSVLIISQHFSVSASDLSRANKVFFTRNGWASVLLLAMSVLGQVLG